MSHDSKTGLFPVGFREDFDGRNLVATESKSLKEQLRWRLNRLRCMTPSELPHRVLRALSTRLERIGLFGSTAVPAANLGAAPHHWVHAASGIDAAPYLDAADRIAAGRFDIFALEQADLGSPPRWNRDPKTGIEAPLSFGKLLDYRNPLLVGDIKYLWEPNRHLHLVTLAQAYSLSRNPWYFEVLRQHLESWFTQCPYRMGPNWTSALEVAIRLINWSVAWQLLGGAHARVFQGAQGEQLRRHWLESIYQHAQFVRGHFSRHSSANNHLIGEAAGLFIAALTWPHWRGAGAWLEQAKAILEREATLQVAADGVTREQSTSYQQFVLEFLLLTLLAGRANGQWFSVAYESRIEAMLEFLASIMDARGNVPMLGDADDALVVRLDARGDSSTFRSLLASGALLFARGDFKIKAASLGDTTRWLMGEQADALFDGLPTNETRLPVRQAFSEGGYYILGCDFEGPDEIRLIADAGPLGYRTIAAHGHADALAFTLSVGGLEFLIDPGTYAYHTQGAWRGYFRGTAAHNTVRVDATDQSEPGGNFMWLRKARAQCDEWASAPTEDVFEGWQDGYQRLDDPVAHRRRITLRKAHRRVIVEDTLQMAAQHDIELMFHCSEHCHVEPCQDGYLLSQGGRTLQITLPRIEAASSQVIIGGVEPMFGWVSRRFDYKQPAPTIVWRARLKGEAILRTEIAC